MGAWSHEPFGNDTASDWAYGLEEATDLSILKATFSRVFEEGAEYLESDVAEEAIAAIEVIAKLLGKGTQSDAYTEAVDTWVQSIEQEPSTALLQQAQKVITRILAEDSELLELWEDNPEWIASMAKLSSAISN